MTETPSQWADDPDRLLDYAGVAQWVGVPERSIRKWIAAGTGPAPIRLGRHIRFRVRDVLAWLDQRAEATTPTVRAAYASARDAA